IRFLNVRRLPIDGREHDLTMKLLQAATRMKKFVAQPFQECRMRRLPAIETEIVRRLAESRTEMIMPQPIDNRSSGEGIVRRRKPFRQCFTTRRFRTVG